MSPQHAIMQTIFIAQSTPVDLNTRESIGILVAAAVVSGILALTAGLMLLRSRVALITAKEANQNQLHSLCENLKNAIVFEVDQTAHNHYAFRFLSKGIESIFHIDHASILNDPQQLLTRIRADQRQQLKECAKLATAEMTQLNVELALEQELRREKWIRIEATPSREDGLLKWTGVAHDITAQKEAEYAHLSEQHSMKHFFDAINAFLLVCSNEGEILHSNKSIETHLDYTHQELKGMPFKALFETSERIKIAHAISEIERNSRSSCNIKLQTRHASQLPAEMTLSKGYWKKQPVIFVMAQNIVDRQQLEHELMQSKEMLKQILDTIPISVFWKEKDSTFAGCNRSFLTECKLADPSELIGKTAFDLFDLQTAQQMTEQDQQVIRTNTPMLNFMQTHTHPDGSLGWRKTSKVALHNKEGDPVGLLGMWHDVTEYSQAQERLKRTLDDLERFNQLMRGRERRTLELKQEVNRLLGESGMAPKYSTVATTPRQD